MRLTISNSALQMYKDCPKKFQNAYLRQYGASTAAQTIGIEIHEELERVYRDRLEKSPHPIVNAYLSHYPMAEDELRGFDALERHLEAPVGNIEGVDVVFNGSIDMTLGNVIVDHKTTSAIFFLQKQFEFESQFSGYRWLLAENGEDKFQHYMINGIQTKPDRTGIYPCGRYTYEFTKSLGRVRDELVWWLGKLIRDLKAGIFYGNYSHCQSYGGCLYRGPCRDLTNEAECETLALSFEKKEPKNFKLEE